MKKFSTRFATLVLLAAALVGCATLQEHESEARLITMYATIKIIDGDLEKAARVESIAQEVRDYATGEKSLSIDLLIGQIESRVRWEKLDAADELLVRALLDEVRLRLVERFGADPLPEDLRLAANLVAEWVITAARMT